MKDKIESVPEAIGLAVMDGGNKIMSPLFEAGTRIPPGGIAKAKSGYKKADKDASSVEIAVYQGENKLVEHNTQLGSITFDELESGVDPEYEIEFTLDQDGQLSAKMTNLDTDETVSAATVSIQP